MNRNRLLFYAVFALFHICLVAFSIYVDAQKDDFTFLTKLLSMISFTKYCAIAGLILFIVDFAWAYTVNKKNEHDKNTLGNELTTLKAKLFDLQEDAKKDSQPHIITQEKPK